MTEPEEKAERRRLMDELQCTELEAAMHVARKMAERRWSPAPRKAGVKESANA